VTVKNAAFAGIIDYAGLFPPAGLAMRPALDAYARASDSPEAWMVDRFVVPASRLGELATAYAGTASLRLCVILDAGSDPTGWSDRAQAMAADVRIAAERDGRLQIRAFEAPLPPLRRQRDTYDAAIGQLAAILSAANLRAVPTYFELARDDRWLPMLAPAMRVAARYGFGAKVRCGGANAEAVPSCEELAAFVSAAAEAGVPFKATAGLHHPLRHLDLATGAPMHGFLNLLAAALVARHEDDPAAVEAALGEEEAAAFRFDETTFRWRERCYDAVQVGATRAAGFVAFGSCSIDEPVDDLRALGILEGAAA